ncbi:MAG: hypothetical protein EA407_07505 [Rhodobacteraceae bacterium]|nr:MAG: hypothetical protein EA407_07505 [Paracoccaceae bacterium]
MTLTPDQSIDPKGLIREAYRIEGISDAECRSILIDWALSLPTEASTPDALAALIALHAANAPDHPMTALLHEGLTPTPSRRNRKPR